MSDFTAPKGWDFASAPKRLIAFISSHSLSLPTMGRKPRLHGLHGLRAMAALMVVLFHLHGILGLAVPDSLRIVTTHFGFGVYIFFILSAFSLAFSNPRAIDDVGGFYLKRLFRIAPLFYVMIVVYSVCFEAPSIPVLISNLTFTFNLIPGKHQSVVWAGWTIGVEMLFYLMLPIILVVCASNIALAVGAVVTVLVSYSSYFLIAQSIPSVPTYSLMAFPTNLAVFFAGIVAYRIYLGVQDRHAKPIALIAATGALVAMALLLGSPGLFLFLDGQLNMLVWIYAFAAVCLWQALWPCWPFNTRVAQWAGERSYSLYLLHPLLIYSLGDVYTLVYRELSSIGNWAFLACAAITLPLLFALSAFTYWLIEGPGYALGTYLRRRRAAARSDRTASLGTTP